MYSIIIACIWVWGASALTKDEQKDVLMQMYFGTEGSSWRYADGWNTDADICTWSNVFCDNDGNVNKIDFENQGLKGTIPEVLGTMQTLTHLRLQKNHELKGTIPKSLFGLQNLKLLELADNSLTGTIPTEMNSAVKLTHLQFTYNKLTGTIPHWNQLKYLEYLCFGGNKLSGPIPDIEGLHAVNRFSLFSNQLTGTIPVKHTLNNLEHLYLDDNKLSGNLPLTLGSVLPNLLDMYISKNQFTGPLPASIKSLTKLRTFYSFENKLSGPLPIEFNYMKNLIYLNISNNEFTGKLPNSLGSFHDLIELDVSTNKMTGTLPVTYKTLTKLRTFAISNNEFSGTIPNDFSVWTDLEYFRASHNKITGTLPEQWGEIPYMIEMRLDNNQICGKIPHWLTNAPMIHTMTLDVNLWSCPIENYSDDQKKFCDYSSTMQCSTMPLTHPDTCTFQTTTTTTTEPTTTAYTAPPVAADSFESHLIYSDAGCSGGSDVVKILHEIYSEVACADEAYFDLDCGPWYYYNDMNQHCSCVLGAHGRCHKMDEEHSSVYHITYLSPRPTTTASVLLQEAEKRSNFRDHTDDVVVVVDEKSGFENGLYAIFGVLTGLSLQLGYSYCRSQANKRSQDLAEILMDDRETP